MGSPLAYFITFHTYGTWLHGDERGSVDREHNEFGTPVIAPDAKRFLKEARARRFPCVVLSDEMRRVVDRTVLEVCEHRAWRLHAVNARTNHVHIVVWCGVAPEMAMNSFKSWCTRRMVEAGLHPKGFPAWTRHGSTRYLWSEETIAEKMWYTMQMQ